MRNGWGWMAGLGAAGLLVAGAPVLAGTGKAGSTASTAETQSERDKALPGSTGSMGSESTGTAGTTDPSATGSMGSTSTSGAEHHASAMGTSQNQVTGKVDKFDKSKNELTLSLKVSESTQVTKDGQTASLADIKEGDQIRASFSGSGESLQVNQIEVMSSGSTGISTDPSGTSTGSTSSETPSGTSTGSSTSDPSGTRGQ